MISKKHFIPIIILVAVVLLTAASSVVTSIALKPTVTEHEFPFSVTYELNGETKIIQGVYVVRYDGNGGYNDSKTRTYVGEFKGGDTDCILYTEDDTRIELETKLYADYLMGDPLYDYFEDDVYEPKLWYYDAFETAYDDAETLAAHGVKLVSWEYPEPIDNAFVFSHFSRMNGAVILWTTLVGILGMIAMLIFVKRSTDLSRKPIDIVSMVLNILIGVFAMPVIAFLSWIFDVTGDNDHLFNQMLYFTPALTLFGITLSIAMRRKGFAVSSLLVQLIGPAVFGIMMLIGLLSTLVG